jgi:Ser/Thr protein kinase RdoA (MazF antagonist)
LVVLEGTGIEAVLREFQVADPSVAGEAAVLRALDGLGGLGPRLLVEGVDRHVPWLLLSKLPGVADITTRGPGHVASALGAVLARVHHHGHGRFAHLRNVTEMRGGGLDVLSGPAAAHLSASWQRLVDQPSVLTHFDFWSGNVLWDGDRISGVVDWNGGSLGPRSFDVGWCRLDLYLLFGEAAADHFLHAYEVAYGEPLADRALADLWAVARSHETVESWTPNYLGLGRSDLTPAVLRARHGEWTERSLSRPDR